MSGYMRSHKYSFKNIKPKLVNDLVRVGNKKEDGGYILSKRQIELTKVLVGLGINYDWTFEEEFKTINEHTEIYCYDFSISESIYLKHFASAIINVVSINSYTKEIFNKRSPHTVFGKPFLELKTYFKFKSFFHRKGNYFFQLGVSNMTYDQFITPKELFKNITSFDTLPDNSIYVKMDIEESEYDILEDLLEHSAKINGMAIEFHDLRHFWSDFTFLIEKIREQYEIIHIHGNNCCGYIPGTEVPNFIEMSVMKRSLMTREELDAINNNTYPLATLDLPNLPNKPDMKISFQ